MKNKFVVFFLSVIGLLLLTCPGIIAQQSDSLYSFPNLQLPPEEGSLLIDTIYCSNNGTIDDINFYIGITAFSTLPGELIIRAISPWGAEVTLQNHDNEPQFPCWIDSHAEEDGPGDLDSYVGYSAQGPWVMEVERYAGSYPFIWESWGIEVISEQVNDLHDDANLPLVTGIDMNYPNPFNSYTIIHFTIAQPADISFGIYDVAGRLVRDFELSSYEPGHHQLKWDGANNAGETVSSGLYFLKMTAGGENDRQVYTSKLTLLK